MWRDDAVENTRLQGPRPRAALWRPSQAGRILQTPEDVRPGAGGLLGPGCGARNVTSLRHTGTSWLCLGAGSGQFFLSKGGSVKNASCHLNMGSTLGGTPGAQRFHHICPLLFPALAAALGAGVGRGKKRWASRGWPWFDPPALVVFPPKRLVFPHYSFVWSLGSVFPSSFPTFRSSNFVLGTRQDGE